VWGGGAPFTPTCPHPTTPTHPLPLPCTPPSTSATVTVRLDPSWVQPGSSITAEAIASALGVDPSLVSGVVVRTVPPTGSPALGRVLLQGVGIVEYQVTFTLAPNASAMGLSSEDLQGLLAGPDVSLLIEVAVDRPPGSVISHAPARRDCHREGGGGMGCLKCGRGWRGLPCGQGTQEGWCGVVWCGVVWCGVVWCGVVWWGPCRVWQPPVRDR
jgi:hypothetical protein